MRGRLCREESVLGGGDRGKGKSCAGEGVYAGGEGCELRKKVKVAAMAKGVCVGICAGGICRTGLYSRRGVVFSECGSASVYPGSVQSVCLHRCGGIGVVEHPKGGAFVRSGSLSYLSACKF